MSSLYILPRIRCFLIFSWEAAGWCRIVSLAVKAEKFITNFISCFPSHATHLHHFALKRREDKPKKSAFVVRLTAAASSSAFFKCTDQAMSWQVLLISYILWIVDWRCSSHTLNLYAFSVLFKLRLGRFLELN